MSNQLFDAYFTAPAMREVFSDRGRLQGMLDFEAALARAEAAAGLVPTALWRPSKLHARPNAMTLARWPMPSPPLAIRRSRW